MYKVTFPCTFMFEILSAILRKNMCGENQGFQKNIWTLEGQSGRKVKKNAYSLTSYLHSLQSFIKVIKMRRLYWSGHT